MRHKTLFLTLKVFAATGGIEKVCRVAGKALYEWSITNNSRVEIYSMYDKNRDGYNNKYFPNEIFRGFNEDKIKFILSSIWNSRNTNTVIISHINLLIVGWLIKLLMPQKRIILFAHGIEVWGKLNRFRRITIKSCDLIIPVSQFTSQKLTELNQLDTNKCKVLNNCLDPFLPLGKEFKHHDALRHKYGFKKDDIILFTLTRLSSKERYKGYDKVIQAMDRLKTKYSNIKYLIAGSYDSEEIKYINNLSRDLGLFKDIVITGFINEDDLVAHFSMANIYVMPSMKEGFGIVFIEAMYYGLPVIAGNKDGSVDALLNGELGTLVNPLNVNEIKNAIDSIIENKSIHVPNRHKLISSFSYESYKHKFEKILEH